MKKSHRGHFVVGGLLAMVLVGAYAITLKLSTTPALADKPSNCATIKGGTITDTKGNLVVLGYDKWGYNYEAHMFNGFADNFSRPTTPVTSGDKLNMKWGDAWLANVDCNYDGKLDRGLVDGTVSGTSMGWLTNQYVGNYTDTSGNAQHYTDFVKIVWVGAGGDLWGQYHIIQEVYNDTGVGHTRTKDKSPGFGLNQQWTQL